MRVTCFFFCFLGCSLFLKAQSPGGVSANLQWWLKANTGVLNNSSTAATDGQTALQWTDQSTISNQATQPTLANQPLFKTNIINGNPVLRYSSDQFFDATSAPGITAGFTYFLVFKQNSFTAGMSTDGVGTYIIDRPSNTVPLASLKLINTDKYFLQRRDNSNGGPSGPVSGTSAVTGTFTILDLYRDAGDNFGIILNGRSDATASITGALTVPTIRLGRHATTTNGGLNGDIAEVVVYNTFPTATQRQQIESYLAIKYGITLDQASGGKDYLASDGVTVVYPATTSHASYINNIAGIGQDNGSGLTQLSSQSQNSASIVAIGNPSAPGDGKFLIWGADTQVITNSSNTPASYSNRLSPVWRVKHTGNLGTVDISFDLSGLGISTAAPAKFALLTNNAPDLSTATASTATRTIVGNTVKFTGITLTDGLYFSLAIDFIPGPGGVATPISWLRADNGVYVDAGITLATNSQTVQQWNNSLGSAAYNVSQPTAGNRPTYFTGTANNNPVINYPVTGKSLDFGTMSIAPTSSTEAFLAIKPTSADITGSTSDGIGSYFIDRTSGTQGIFDLKANTGNKFGFQKRNDVGGGLGGPITTSSISATTMQLVNFYRNYNVQYGIAYNGAVENTQADADGPTTLPSLRLGNHATTNVGLVGDFPEFILFARTLTSTERNRVNSYLAIKYGITLSQSVASDYLSSSGNIIYASSSTYSTYSADIAGIGRDDVSSLLQLNSQSVNAGSMVNIQIASLGTDLSFLIWGSNNGSVSTPNASDVAAPVVRRLSRVWRVAQTGTVGTVTVKIDLSTIPGAKVQADLRLLVDADGVFNAGATALTGTLTGSIFTVAGVTLANGNYFTIGTTNSVSTPLPVTLTKFEVSRTGDHVQSIWTTASELNSDYFDIERSGDGIKFEYLGRIKSAGTTTIAQHYSWVDEKPLMGESYYRLKQVDINKAYVYSPIRSIDFDNPGYPQVSVYPNPNTGGSVNLELLNWKGTAAVVISDLTGRQVYAGYPEQDRLHEGVFSIDLPAAMPAGLYFVFVKGAQGTIAIKLEILR